jgi:rhodanese-related sulfurtransferase
MSTKSAGLAKKLGYTNIKVMLKGVPGWKKAGNQVVVGDGFVNKGNIILVDLRSEAASAAGHIARTVNIPFDELEDFKDDFNLKAPVVVYGSDAVPAYKMLAKWGIKGVALIDGGLQGYTARGNKLESGEPAIEIEWIRKLGKGEVDSKEFLAAVAGNASQVVLDVRTEDETGKGKFSNSIAIPLDNLEGRLAELPKGKEIIVHCSTGARAEMAHAALKKAGFKSRFLVADLVCEGGGNCTLE